MQENSNEILNTKIQQLFLVHKFHNFTVLSNRKILHIVIFYFTSLGSVQPTVNMKNFQPIRQQNHKNKILYTSVLYCTVRGK